MNPTASAPTKTGIFWTQFPAGALTDRDGLPVDWSDHKASHRAVGRLFAPRLPGNPGERRSEAGILYRVDVLGVDREPTVLVQSLLAPELTPSLSRSTEISRRSWDIESGDQVAFRVAVNPVIRTTRHYTDETRTKPTDWSNRPGVQVPRKPDPKDGKPRRVRAHVKRTESVVPVSDVEGWLASKMGDAFADVSVLNHFRDKLRSGPQLLVVDTFDAVAAVRDPEALNELRIRGIGRAKSYGCGLLTLTRHG